VFNTCEQYLFHYRQCVWPSTILVCHKTSYFSLYRFSSIHTWNTSSTGFHNQGSTHSVNIT